MKIRRYVARDMREALAQIKEELGADAVILSNKKIAEGVELMAAVDYHDAVAAPQKSIDTNTEKEQNQATSNNTFIDNPQITAAMEREIDNDIVSLASVTDANTNATTQNKIANQQASDDQGLAALLNRSIQKNNQTATANEHNNLNQLSSEADISAQLKSFTARLQQSNDSEAQIGNKANHYNAPSDSDETGDSLLAQTPYDQAAHNIPLSTTATVNQQEFDSLKSEMASIRQLLEYQVSGLLWQDLAQKDPVRAMLVERLTSLGLTEHIADQIAGFVPKQTNQNQAWQQALQLLTRQVNTTNNDIINRGGIVALVGPTGVGKTTTIAKLAARFAQSHGQDSVALISTDTFRIAGFEQLQTYGRIIGCQVKLAKNKDALDALLQEFSTKKLVLIDTAGMGQRDLRLAESLTTLIANSRVRIRNYLVLAANTQQAVMQENVERFKKIPLVGCIYTKLDESLSAGEIITTAIQNGLPIGYLTDGQRVPEDIKVANAEKLVMLANKMATKHVRHSTRQQSTTMKESIAAI
jgi:flagellar biosynthesis protein FlhF